MGKVIGRIDYTDTDFDRGFELTAGKRVAHFVKKYKTLYALPDEKTLSAMLHDVLDRRYEVKVMPGHTLDLRITERQCGAVLTMTFDPCVDIDVDAALSKRSMWKKHVEGNVDAKTFFEGSIAKLFTKFINGFPTTGKLHYHIGKTNRVFLLDDRHYGNILFTI